MLNPVVVELSVVESAVDGEMVDGRPVVDVVRLTDLAVLEAFGKTTEVPEKEMIGVVEVVLEEVVEPELGDGLVTVVLGVDAVTLDTLLVVMGPEVCIVAVLVLESCAVFVLVAGI